MIGVRGTIQRALREVRLGARGEFDVAGRPARNLEGSGTRSDPLVGGGVHVREVRGDGFETALVGTSGGYAVVDSDVHAFTEARSVPSGSIRPLAVQNALLGPKSPWGGWHPIPDAEGLSGSKERSARNPRVAGGSP